MGMNYDGWKANVPDDDPFGEHQDELDDCQECGARYDEPCTDECRCAHCIGKSARAAARRIADGPEAA